MKSFFSPGKVILSGEHSVVYGQPALVMSLPLGITVEIVDEGEPLTAHTAAILNVFKEVTGRKLEGFSFQIKSTLPQNSGLGSSAALAYSLLQAAADYEGVKFSKEQYFDLVQKSEVFAHGKPSGIDASAVVYGGVQRFQKRDGKFIREPVLVGNDLSYILLQSGKAKETTKQMVESVSKHENKDEILEKIGFVTTEIENQLKKGELDLELIAQNQGLLESLGVVGKKAKQMIRQIEAVGGYAKIAGAGGVEDGSGAILVFHKDLGKIINLAEQSQWQIIYRKEGIV